jgi:hypothetical protein
MRRMNLGRVHEGPANFGAPWVLLCLAFCAHVADEALTGFLPVYNATVILLRNEYAWFPMPTFEYRDWLIGLIVANAVFLLLTPFAFRNARWLRPLAYFYAGVHLLNGLGHTLATIFGQTVSSVHFSRPAPGFYSSPLLIAGSIYLLVRLRDSAQRQGEAVQS